MKTFGWLVLAILLIGAAPPRLGGTSTPPVDYCTDFACQRRSA
jgi:hypothetical protein